MANEPTAQDQYMLELLNRARLNPQAEANRYIDPVIGGTLNLNEGVPIGETISTAAKQPLAFNLKLFTAANKHTQWMFANNIFDHVGVNGSQVGVRATTEGYSLPQALGENLAWRGTTGSIDWTNTVGQQHQDLFVDKGIVDRGHRTNMMNPIYREIGISSVLGNFVSEGTSFNSVMTTQNFGKDAGQNAFLTGVAYTDLVANDDFYTVGEGLANITVNAVAANGQTFSTTSLTTGGYSLRLAAGTYNVSFSGDFNNDGVVDTSAVRVVSIGSDNVKQDFTSDTQATEGNDILNGSANADIIDGLGGNDTIFGGAGNDTINGGSGNDSIQGGLGQDTLDGGTGIDTVDYTTFNGNGIYNLGTGTANLGSLTEQMLNFENIIAGGGNDTITGTAGENNLQGGAGNDYLQGGFGKDTLDGGAGVDTADYTTFNGNGTYNLTAGTAILTGAFTETMTNFENIIAGGGNDTITGTAGANTLYGGAGADNINGGAGNDYIQGGLGQDYLDGGAGIDTVDYTTFNGNGTYNLTAGTAILTGAFNETMLNFESILAGGGNDIITGTAGANTLNGGAGNDSLTGGAGNDNFYFGGAAISATNTVAGSLGNDTITDFTHDQDKIVLSQAAFSNIINAAGGLSFESVPTETFVFLSSAKIVYSQTSHLLYYKNAPAGAPTPNLGASFATLNIGEIGFNLSASDFNIVA